MSYYKKDGTLYSITGGLTKHQGSIEKLEVGLTKIDGTVYEIDLQQPLITETKWELRADASDPASYNGTWAVPYSGYYRITTIGGGGGGAGTMCVAGVCNWKDSDSNQYSIFNSSDLAIGGGGAGGSGPCNQFIVKLRRRESLEYSIGRGGASGSNKLISLVKDLGTVSTTNKSYSYFSKESDKYSDYKKVSADRGEDGTSSIIYSQYHDILAQSSGGQGGQPGEGSAEATSWDTLMLGGLGGDGGTDGEPGTATTLRSRSSGSSSATQGGSNLQYAEIGAGGNGGGFSWYTGTPTGSVNTPQWTVFTNQEPIAGADGGIIIEYLEEDTTLTPECSINYDCSNAAIDSHRQNVLKGSSYINTITALDGYAFDSYTITMNDKDISQYCTPSSIEYYTTEISINVPSITGDICFSCKGEPLVDVKISVEETDLCTVFLNGTWYGTNDEYSSVPESGPNANGQCGTDMHQLVIKNKMPTLKIYSYVGYGSQSSSGYQSTSPNWKINGSIKNFIVDKPIAIIAKTTNGSSTDSSSGLTTSYKSTVATVQYQEEVEE